MKRLRRVFPAAVLAGALLAGCSGQQPQPAEGPKAGGSAYLLSEEPEGAREVLDVLKDAADGDDVVLVGRIGGDVNPWVEDVAAFNVADNSLVPCNEREGDTCPAPWDYCCEADLGKATTLVQVVDAEGWRRIDAAETTAGAAAGRPRVKLCTREALLTASRH